MMKKLVLLTLGVGIFYSSCYYDVEQELYPSACDVTNVQYSVQVQNILKTSCQNCHDKGVAQGGVILDNYIDLKKSVDNGLLLKAIRHESGAVAMPLGASKIPQCSIDQIAAWIEKGALNN